METKTILTVALLNTLVSNEAKKLKKKATKSELTKLDFESLQPSSKRNCIYGQMTGDCFSDRAVELIEGSCTKVLERIPAKSFNDPIKGTLNGSPKKSFRDDYWSPIEMFIDQPRNKKNGNNKRLIKYLKGETEVLKLR